MKNEKIALFGGTFNPPHIGHIKAFEAFCKRISPDKVYVMPTKFPPHKEISAGDRPAVRFHMAKLAFDGICENAVFSAMEIFRRGKSFSIDTVNELLSYHKAEKIYMFVGSDMLFFFEKWKDFKELFKKCILVTTARCDGDIDEVRKVCEKYKNEYSCEYIILDLVPTEISSTRVRELAAQECCGRDELKKYLTEELYGYIIKEKLYSDKNVCEDISTDEQLSRTREVLPFALGEKRLLHTLSVERTALEMAEIFLPLYGYEKEYLRDISLSALLHDITKTKDEDWHRQYLCRFMPEGFLKDSAAVLHSWSGAYYAFENYFVNPRVFRAIYNHTTGCADMDIFEKIIFLADYIEPQRTHDSCKRLRGKYLELIKNGVSSKDDAEKLLDSLVLASLNDTYSYLSEKNAYICPKLFETKEFLEKKYCEV